MSQPTSKKSATKTKKKIRPISTVGMGHQGALMTPSGHSSGQTR